MDKTRIRKGVHILHEAFHKGGCLHEAFGGGSDMACIAMERSSTGAEPTDCSAKPQDRSLRER